MIFNVTHHQRGRVGDDCPTGEESEGREEEEEERGTSIKQKDRQY